MLLLSSADFFSKNTIFQKYVCMNTIRMSNGLDPDQDRQNVGSDLFPNYLQRPSADEKKSQRSFALL